MEIYLFLNDSVRGPYEEKELRDMLEHREVHPETPACRAGEEAWGTVAGLLPGAAAPEPLAEPASPIPQKFRYSDGVPSNRATAESARGEVAARVGLGEEVVAVVEQGGLGRLSYWLAAIAIILVEAFLEWLGLLSGGILSTFVLFGALTWLSVYRHWNIGVSGWWSVLLLVPVINVFYGVYVSAVPPGYARTRKLDITAWVLIFFQVAILGLMLFLMGVGLAEIAHRNAR
jgi:uncharacterized membrane protein YhaH (DUF805 family)